MSHYRGPRFKKICHLGTLPRLTSKRPKSRNSIKNQLRFGERSQYRIRLEEKQKLHFHYDLTERQLVRYVHIARKAKGSIGQVLQQQIEICLDDILLRLGMASTIPGAKQIVNYRHILVNGRTVDIPSYHCKPLDIITMKDKQKLKALIQNYIVSHPLQGIAKTFDY